MLQLSRCNIKNQSEIIKDTKHWQQFSIFFSYFTHFLDYTHEIPATTSSTRLQYSNEPQLMLSIILPNLSVINHNIGVLGRDYNFIFFLFRFRDFPFPFIFFILLLSNLTSYIFFLQRPLHNFTCPSFSRRRSTFVTSNPICRPMTSCFLN